LTFDYNLCLTNYINDLWDIILSKIKKRIIIVYLLLLLFKYKAIFTLQKRIFKKAQHSTKKVEKSKFDSCRE